jgi:hypothetical protein
VPVDDIAHKPGRGEPVKKPGGNVPSKAPAKE